MPRARPTRSAASKAKKYVDEESDPDSAEEPSPEEIEDDLFQDSEGSDDDMDDPDSIEVPGGGKSLKEVITSIPSPAKATTAQDSLSTTSSTSANISQIPRINIQVPSLTKISAPTSSGPPPLIPLSSQNDFQKSGSRSQDLYSAVLQGLGSSPFLSPNSNPLANLSFLSGMSSPMMSPMDSMQQKMTTPLLLPQSFIQGLSLAVTKGEVEQAEVNSLIQLAYSNPTYMNILRMIIEQNANSGSLYGLGMDVSNTRMTPHQILKFFETRIGLIRMFEMSNGFQNSPLAQMQQNKAARYKPSVEALWGTSNFRVNDLITEPENEAEDDEDELGVDETYSQYEPSKLKIGVPHPDPVVETASLASVYPPDVKYKLSLPESVIKKGLLSGLQLESIVYACQQHEHMLPTNTRAGFLIGDGAGVGKGRTIAGIIYENYMLKKKKSIWITVSTDLVYDSLRDLRDIGADKIAVHQLSKQKYGRLNLEDGVLFLTYSGLIGESSTKGKYNTRLKQIIDWFGRSNDGVVVFDECHRAKNLSPMGGGKPTKTGVTVEELQKLLPKARVVYASATGASEPRHMAYMTRLGLWGPSTPFPDFQAFVKSVDKRGVSAMEIVAMDMKLRGTYIARQLSFQGVKFSIEEVPLPPNFAEAYNDSVEFWVHAKNKFIEGTVLMKLGNKEKKSVFTNFWGAHQRYFKYLCIASKVKHAVSLARNAIKDGKCVVIGLQSTGEARTLDQMERDEGELTDFVSTAKGVLQHLVENSFPGSPHFKKQDSKSSATSSLFQTIIKEMEDDVKSSTGKAGPSSGKRKPVRKAAQKQNYKKLRHDNSSDESGEDDSEFELSNNSSSEDSEPSDGAMSSSMESDADSDDLDESAPVKKKGKKHSSKKQKASKPVKRVKDEDGIPQEPVSAEAKEMVRKIRKELLDRIDQLGEKLPPNTLDQLIDELGGPTEVAEMTGRRGRVVQDDQGTVSYETRQEADVSLETINLKEKERFMSGEKLIAIISEAASSGISLQSDKRVLNQRKRLHITLELPWSADRAIQQFGRTHRSNQLSAPEYVFLISNLAGEQRFASIVAKRLESLGALTHGDRRATESRDFSRYNIDNKFGRLALDHVMKAVMEMERPLVPAPKEYDEGGYEAFFNDAVSALVGVGLVVNSGRGLVLDKDSVNMTKFLNRILGMPIRSQNGLFQYFTDTLAYIVKQAKRNGRYDAGILDVSSGGKDVTHVVGNSYKRNHATGVADIELHEILVNRGLDWDSALDKHGQLFGNHEGFYVSKRETNNKRLALLALREKMDGKESNSDLYIIYRPHIGLQPTREVLADLLKKYDKVEPEEAEDAWKEQYDFCESNCTHAYWNGNCKTKLAGFNCQTGVRRRTIHVLSGSVLLVWNQIESIVAKYAHREEAKMQIIRVKGEASGEKFKIIGLHVPNDCVEELKSLLEQQQQEFVNNIKANDVMSSSDSD